MRVFATSDIHVDYAANFDWLRSLSVYDFTEDILILAGDVSDNLALIAESLELLLGKFRKVCFVPGNHELWVKGSEFNCSLEKFAAIKDLCKEIQVISECHREGDITFVPLYSWYDYSFAAFDEKLKRAWRDYRCCVWPAYLNDNPQINKHFLEMNLPVLQQTNKVVISYSHFVPRIDLMPKRIPLKKRNIYPVLGSVSLGMQVTQLKPDVHIYGHSHVNQAIDIEGIHYVNNAFGYPSELRIARKRLHCIYQHGQLQTDTLTGRPN